MCNESGGMDVGEESGGGAVVVCDLIARAMDEWFDPSVLAGLGHPVAQHKNVEENESIARCGLILLTTCTVPNCLPFRELSLASGSMVHTDSLRQIPPLGIMGGLTCMEAVVWFVDADMINSFCENLIACTPSTCCQVFAKRHHFQEVGADGHVRALQLSGVQLLFPTVDPPGHSSVISCARIRVERRRRITVYHAQRKHARLGCSHCTDHHGRGARLSWKGFDVLKGSGAGRSA